MNKPQKLSLGEMLNFKRGYDLTKEEIKEGIYPVVGSNGIIGFHNKFNVKSPCLTVGRSGTVGIPHFYSQDCWVHNTCLYVEDFKNNDSQYLFYLLKTLQIDKVASSTGVPTLNRNFVHPLKVKAYKDIKIQKSISKILIKIDEKIKLNNQINQELGKLLKTLYDYWFVQFDFPDENNRPLISRIFVQLKNMFRLAVQYA